MNMQQARQLLQDALDSGLTLHGVSINGKPAISFDGKNPRAHVVRASFFSTDGLMRELLRAAMIEECQRKGLPESLPVPDEFCALDEMQDLPVGRLH